MRLLITLLMTLFLCSFDMRGESLKEWTILTYMNADNTLNSAADVDLKEMQKVINKNVNVVVQVDKMEIGDTKRVIVEGGEIKEISQLGEIDMGNWKELVDFAKWGINNYPAKRYAIILWNHGSGWVANKYNIKSIIQGISYDDDSGNHITTPQLKESFDEISKYLGKNVDLIGFDACLMQMFEVSFEIKDFSKVIVGSEETEPGNGWPYDLILQGLEKNSNIEADKLSNIIVEEYNRSYNGGTQGWSTVTQSSLKSDKLDKLLDAFNLYTDQLITLIPTYKKQISDSITATLKFYDPNNKDLIQFINQVGVRINDARLKLYSESVLKLFNELMLSNGANGSLATAKGLAIYIPLKSTWQSNKSTYLELEFSKKGKWDEFLNIYFK